MMPSGRVCTSGPCQWMCALKHVLCLSACIALLCVYMIYMKIWLLGGGLVVRSGCYYMVKRFVFSSVCTHTLIPSPYLLPYPLSGASRVTHMLPLGINEDTALG